MRYAAFSSMGRSIIQNAAPSVFTLSQYQSAAALNGIPVKISIKNSLILSVTIEKGLLYAPVNRVARQTAEPTIAEMSSASS